MKQILLFFMILFVLSSCKKDKEESNTSPPPATPINPYDCYIKIKGRLGWPDNSTLVSKDNNLIICGNTFTSNINTGIFIHKISKKGSTIWRKDYASQKFSITGIVETTNHDLFICGSNLSNHDILLIKTNSSGDTLWSRTYGGTLVNIGDNIIATSDGNLVISGLTETFGAPSSSDIYIIKVDTNGDTLWTKHYPDPGPEETCHLLETNDGGYLISGSNGENQDVFQVYFLKVNANGDLLWSKKSTSNKYANSTIELSNGDLMTCGQTPTPEILVTKTDNMGNLIWEKTIGDDTLTWRGNSIKQNADGTFTIVGDANDFMKPQDYIVLLKIDQNGNKLWLKKLAGYEGSGWNLIKDINDDNIITGMYYYANDENTFMLRTDSNGNLKLPE